MSKQFHVLSVHSSLILFTTVALNLNQTNASKFEIKFLSQQKASCSTFCSPIVGWICWLKNLHIPHEDYRRLPFKMRVRILSSCWSCLRTFLSVSLARGISIKAKISTIEVHWKRFLLTLHFPIYWIKRHFSHACKKVEHFIEIHSWIRTNRIHYFKFAWSGYNVNHLTWAQ